MQFVRTILWIAVALVVALFAIRNSAAVTVNLWSDLQMVTPLWVVVVLSFLAGLLPTLAMYRASRWRWRRRLEQNEKALADAQSSAAALVEPDPALSQPSHSATPATVSPAPGN
jgi:uncharacterized integral membrane protein